METGGNGGGGGGGGGGGFLTKQLSAEAAAILKEGITMVLSKWSALQIAVENELGGRDSRLKSLRLADKIFAWFTQSKEPLYIDDLEDLLDKTMDSDFKTIIDDGSIEEVAYKLMIMHEECLEGNYNSIKSLREVDPRTRAVSHVRQVADNDDSDEDDDDDESMGADSSSNMMVDMPNLLSNSKPLDMYVDEPRPKAVPEAGDGWTTVSSRRNRDKRN